MKRKLFLLTVAMLAICFIVSGVSYAAENESFGAKVKNFWKNLIGYPARVTEESASVVADTGKNSVKVVTSEVKKVGEVTSGDIDKTKDLITEPINQTAQTAAKAAEGVVNIPSEAMKEKASESAQSQEESK